MRTQTSIAARRVLWLLVAACLCGCPDDPEPPASEPDAAAADATDSSHADAPDTGDLDAHTSDTDASQVTGPYHVAALTPGVIRRIDHRPFGDPLFVIFSEVNGIAQIIVYESSTNQVTTHSVELRGDIDSWTAQVLWWSRDTDKFAIQLRHPDFKSDYLQWKPSSGEFNKFAEGLRARIPMGYGKNYTPSGFSYAYDSETSDLKVLDFRRGTVARTISEHDPQSPFIVDSETGRALFNVKQDYADHELFAYDPHNDRVSSLGQSTQGNFYFLESGRALYTSPAGTSTSPTKIWDFDRNASHTVWADSGYSPSVGNGDRFAVLWVSEANTNYQKMGVFDDRRDEIVFTDSGVAVRDVWIHPQGTMAVYRRYTPREGYGYDAEIVVYMLETDETFVIADHDLDATYPPTFAPEGPAVAVPLKAGGVVLWSDETRVPHVLDTAVSPYLWPSPEGDFWVVERWLAEPSSALKAFDLRSEQMMVLGDDPNVPHGNLLTGCEMMISPHGNQVVTRYGRDSEWGESKMALWRRSSGDAKPLVFSTFKGGCPTLIDESGLQRGVVMSFYSHGGLAAWHGDEALAIGDGREIEDFAAGPRLEHVYYTSYAPEADDSLTRLDRWDFDTRQSHTLSTTVVDGEFLHQNNAVAYLESPASCSTNCNYDLQISRTNVDDTPIHVHDEAVGLVEIIDGHVFFRGREQRAFSSVFSMIAAPTTPRP